MGETIPMETWARAVGARCHVPYKLRPRRFFRKGAARLARPGVWRKA